MIVPRDSICLGKCNMHRRNSNMVLNLETPWATWCLEESHRPSHVLCYSLEHTYNSAGKESACNAGDLDLIPGLGRSPGEGKGYTPPVFRPGEFHGLQSMGSQRVALASWTQLSDFDFQSTLVFSVFSTEKDFSLSPPAQMWPVSHFQMRMSPPLHPAKEICSSSEPLGT